MKKNVLPVLLAALLPALLFSACAAVSTPTRVLTAPPEPTGSPSPTPENTDSLFLHKARELAEASPMGIHYAITDIDGDAQDELVVEVQGTQAPPMSIYEKSGQDTVLSFSGSGTLYLNGQGGLILCAGVMAEQYHLYRKVSPTGQFEYAGYSLGTVPKSKSENLYFLMTGRTESFDQVIQYTDKAGVSEYRIVIPGKDDKPIDLSPFEIDKSTYRTLLDKLLDGYTMFGNVKDWGTRLPGYLTEDKKSDPSPYLF